RRRALVRARRADRGVRRGRGGPHLRGRADLHALRSAAPLALGDRRRAVTARTLGDLRAGLCVSARPRDPACDDSAPLWRAIGLPDDTAIAVLRERWTPLAACWLAVADGRGPGVGAVAWVDHGLGTAVLRGANLSSADLRGADLSSADLRGANLSSADLRGAYLPCADLRCADLSDADLRGANLSSADLRGAYLPCADLRCADLSDADLRGANL